MNTTIKSQSIEEISKLGEELLASNEAGKLDPASFDKQLDEFTTATESFILSLEHCSNEVEDSVLRRFIEIHSQVAKATAQAKSKVLERLNALERNKPALLKYLSQKKSDKP